MRKKEPKGTKRVHLPAAALLISLAAVVTLTAGGILAYMTYQETAINQFTIGDVHIRAWEPNWPTKDTDGDGVPDECELLTPHKEVPKDPRIQNTGTNDAVVFFKVTAPVETLTKIAEDGTRLSAADEDLFYYKQAEDAENKHENHFDEKWVELTSFSREFVSCEGVNEEGKGYTYIFGYHIRIAAGETTSNLFDKIQNKMYGSRTIGPDEVEMIRIESYAVQADNIYRDGAPMDTTGTLTQADLEYIYQAYVNQNQS